MFKPSTYLVIAYFPTYLSTNFLQNWLPRWNQILTQLKFIHKLSNNSHPADGALVGAGSLWPTSTQ
jgi:hypothetical protein